LKEGTWDTYYWNIYAELSPGTDLGDVNANIRLIVKDHFPEEGHNPELFLHQMDRWYLYDNFDNGKEAGGTIEYVRIFTWIGSFILLIACINYINLATARSERPSKEVGIRKCIGSPRKQLVIQFLMESLLVSTLSCLIAIMIVKLALPYYNTLVGEKLDLDFAASKFWLLAVGLVLVTGILAGSFPAFYFSSLKPVKVLKGKFIVGRNTTLPRRILVTMQYILAIFLAVGVMVFFQQLNHVKNRQLGYDQQNLLMIACNDEIKRNYKGLKNDLLNSGAVEGVNLTCLPIDHDEWSEDVEWHRNATIEKANFVRASTEFDYTKTMGIRVLAGRDFSEELDHDSTAILVNETAVRIMGFDDPLGQQVKIRNKWKTIVGVIEDVVMGSPFDPVKPTFVAILDDNYNHINIRLSKTTTPSESITTIKHIFKKYTSSNDEYQFADDRLHSKFESMELIGTLAKLFAFLAIFLTALGVMGLAAYTAEQRSKELAIRKVLGATVPSIIMLLSNYFTRIALLAFIIAAPLSWWALDQYLANYSYRISIPWWTFPLTAVVICSITVLIVLSQVFKLPVPILLVH
jgi:putative ABC transport system permease protein